MIHPVADDATRIQVVAEGLMRITHADVAADQLRRLYGEARTTQALLALTGIAPVAAPAQPMVRIPPGVRQHAVQRVRQDTPACRRRGTRPTDWI